MKAFLKKEWMEWSRTGRILILLLIFSLFGVMNPALTKLTPWLIEALSESLADTGLAITSVKIDAMTSWCGILFAASRNGCAVSRRRAQAKQSSASTVSTTLRNVRA